MGKLVRRPLVLLALVGICAAALAISVQMRQPRSGADQPEEKAATTSSVGSTTSTTAAPFGGINATTLEANHGKAVSLVLSRGCDGQGFATGSGFAIDSRTLVTNWHVVAEDNSDSNSAIDPHPWIQSYNRGWRRGTVIGSFPAPDIAVVRLDEAEPDMKATLQWAEKDVVDGDYLAVFGYPALRKGEFQVAIGRAIESEGLTEGIPSFRLDKQLSTRTGPGNSGGPVLTAEGKVAGVITWGSVNRMTWLGEDASAVKNAVDQIVMKPLPANTDCPADSDSRYPLAYTVRLGTFADRTSAQKREDLLKNAGPSDVRVVSVNSDSYSPFLLSDYPFVTMAGPFDTFSEADRARGSYQSALDSAREKDRFSVGVMPSEAFETETGYSGADDFELPESCPELTGEALFVVGVTKADPLKLRASPSLNGKVLLSLANYEELLAGDEDPVTADGVKWIHVAAYDLESDSFICGWVAQRYTL